MSLHEEIDINAVLSNYKRVREKFWGKNTTPVVVIKPRQEAEHDVTERSQLTADDIAALNRISIKPAQQIIIDVCSLAGVSPAAALGESRRAGLAKARQCIMWKLKHDRGYSSYQIGKMLGKDHATIIHGIRQVNKSIEGMPTEWASVIKSGILSR